MYWDVNNLFRLEILYNLSGGGFEGVKNATQFSEGFSVKLK